MLYFFSRLGSRPSPAAFCETGRGTGIFPSANRRAAVRRADTGGPPDVGKHARRPAQLCTNRAVEELIVTSSRVLPTASTSAAAADGVTAAPSGGGCRCRRRWPVWAPWSLPFALPCVLGRSLKPSDTIWMSARRRQEAQGTEAWAKRERERERCKSQR